MAYGIIAAGLATPRRVLTRQAILAANGWFNPGLKALAAGHRAFAHWDEDAITLAVAAARDCLSRISAPRASVSDLRFASTSAPFADRLGAGVIAGALDLPESVAAADHSGNARAGLSALSTALRAGHGRVLIAAGEKRRAKAASIQEMTYGDAGAALLLSEADPIAILCGAGAVTVDFVDHFRPAGGAFDYAWEERWVREAGYLDFVPRAVAGALAQAGLPIDAVDLALFPEGLARIGPALARALGLGADRIAPALGPVIGELGAVHPLFQLGLALETLKPDSVVLLVGFGQGAEALVLRTTSKLASVQAAGAGEAAPRLAQGRVSDNYQQYLAFSDLVAFDHGMRAETDKQTALSALYRHRRTVLAMMGGKCRACGAEQWPKAALCVNPACRAHNSQDDEPFADKPGRILTHTADWLTYTIDPPHCYGMIEFAGGGRAMLDFTDFAPEELHVDQPVRLAFRIKDIDRQRGFVRYFWKAAPAVN